MLCHIEEDGETNVTFILYKKLMQFKKLIKKTTEPYIISWQI